MAVDIEEVAGGSKVGPSLPQQEVCPNEPEQMRGTHFLSALTCDQCGRQAPPEVVRGFGEQWANRDPGAASEGVEASGPPAIWLMRARGGNWGPVDRFACPEHRRSLL